MGIYKKMRLDRILVDRGLAVTRSRAADLIRGRAPLAPARLASAPA